MKAFLFQVLLLLSSITCCYAQSENSDANFKYGEAALTTFLNKEFHDEVKKKNDVNVCLISVTFATFTIDSVGNIKSLKFSENDGTPPVFRNIIAEVINKTNGLWLPAKINGRTVESKPFILPLIYDMEGGCYTRKITVNDGTSNSLIRFFDFKDKNGDTINKLDCVLLRPLHIFSAN